MRFLYLVRRDRAWEDNFTCSTKMNQVFKTDELTQIWDRLFNISWREFRVRLNDLRKKNEHDLNPDYSLSSHQVHSCEQLRDHLVVPTDDDDWFRDDVFDVLRQAVTPDHFAYRWNYAELTVTENRKHEMRVFSYPTNIPYPCWPLDTNYDSISFHYQSNNYAIKSPKNLDIINFHSFADRQLDVRDEKFIPETLSIHNGSMASCSYLRRIQRWYHGDMMEGLTQVHKLFKTEPVSNTEIPAYFEPYIDSMLSLYRELRVK